MGSALVGLAEAAEEEADFVLGAAVGAVHLRELAPLPRAEFAEDVGFEDGGVVVLKGQEGADAPLAADEGEAVGLVLGVLPLVLQLALAPAELPADVAVGADLRAQNAPGFLPVPGREGARVFAGQESEDGAGDKGGCCEARGDGGFRAHGWEGWLGQGSAGSWTGSAGSAAGAPRWRCRW